MTLEQEINDTREILRSVEAVRRHFSSAEQTLEAVLRNLTTRVDRMAADLERRK